MKLLWLAAKNILRNRGRTALTVLVVGVTILVFSLLQTVHTAWTVAADHAAQDRIATRHKVTFIMELPKRYVDDIREVPGVRTATWMNWFGGKDPNHETEFFATIAVDPDTFLQVYDEIVVPPEQADKWRQNRRGVLIGDVLANKLGWKVGDRVTLRGTIFPGEWEFEVDGIYTAKRKTVDRSSLWFHWKYLDESRPERQRNMVGWIVSRIDDPAKAAEISKRIDTMFDERDVQTLSMDEHSLNSSFLGMFSAILRAIDIVSIAVLGILLLIVGNTIAMGVRERTNEYGVMRAIGFLPKHIVITVVGEAITIGLIGGLAGLLLATLLIDNALGPMLEENMGAIFPYFRVAVSTKLAAMGLAVGLAIIAAALPAYRAARLDVVDALRRVG